MRFFRLVLFFSALVFSDGSNAQTFLGLSANFGNQMRFTPGSVGLKTPISISGSIILNGQYKMKNNWVLQYSIGLGSLAYNFKIVSMDTLAAPEASVFLDYTTLYGSFNGLVGREISIQKKKIIIGIGAGASYYLSLFAGTSYGISQANSNSLKRVFYSEMNGAGSKLIGFGKISTQMRLNRLFSVGLEYSYHFSPALEGFYEFSHTKAPSSGTISLYQREFSVVLLVKVSKR